MLLFLFYRMGSVVYVAPLHLLASLFADLKVGTWNQGGFKFEFHPAEEHGVLTDQVSIRLEVPISRANDDPIRVVVSGDRCTSSSEAVRTAVMAVFEAVCMQHDIFSADYNYILLSAKRPLYNTTNEALEEFNVSYNALHDVM